MEARKPTSHTRQVLCKNGAAAGVQTGVREGDQWDGEECGSHSPDVARLQNLDQIPALHRSVRNKDTRSDYALRRSINN